MDGVRLTAPTVLKTPSLDIHRHSRASGDALSSTSTPSGVLLVVAQGGHRLAFHHPCSSSGESVFGFDPQVLADLLLPKPALFDRLFDLTVGDIRLIGCPVWLQMLTPVINTMSLDEPTEAAAEDAEARLRALSVVFVLAAAPGTGHEAAYERTLAGCKSAADQLSRALQREEAYGGLVSKHVARSEDAEGIGSASNTDGSGGERSSNVGTATPGGPASAAVGERDDGGQSLAVNLGGGGGAISNSSSSCSAAAAALLSPAGSGACSSVTGDGQHHQSAGERHDSGGGGLAAKAASSSKTAAAAAMPPTAHPPAAATEVESVLTAALRALQEDAPVTLHVGAFTDVPICTPPPPPPLPCLSAAPEGMPAPLGLRPYHALLPLVEASEMRGSLPPDTSPLLLRVMTEATPLRSLEQLSDETAIPMPMLLVLTRHLQSWKMVRVIYPITIDSVLAVHPEAPLRPPAHFLATFGDDALSDYARMLALFSSAQRFSNVIVAAEAAHVPKQHLVQVTIALLQCDAIRPLHTFIHAVSEPPEPAADAEEKHHSQWRLFMQLRPMLHGEHHVEEILWHERLSRGALLDMLRAFEEHLVCCTTPEGEAQSWRQAHGRGDSLDAMDDAEWSLARH